MKKFTIMKVILVLFILQEAVLEGLASRSLLPCWPLVPGPAWAALILAALLLVETSVMGIASTALYYRYPCVQADAGPDATPRPNNLQME